MQGPRQRNFRALQALEAVSRHLSLTSAAAELGVTQSAISHQIRHLTDELGERLIKRSGRLIELTPAGLRLADRLHDAFAQIDSSIDEIMGTGRETVRLAVSGTFALGWLIGRLPTLYEAHPALALQLRMHASDPELTDQVADAFVTSYPDAAGFWTMELMTEHVVAVVAAGRENGDLAALPLITTILNTGNIGGEWAAFCEFAEIPQEPVRGRRWLETSHYFLAAEMARLGIGVALVPDFLVAKDLEEGRLRLFHEARMPTGEDYHLCIKSSRRQEPALRTLETWFRAQSALTPSQA